MSEMILSSLLFRHRSAALVQFSGSPRGDNWWETGSHGQLLHS